MISYLKKIFKIIEEKKFKFLLLSLGSLLSSIFDIIGIGMVGPLVISFLDPNLLQNLFAKYVPFESIIRGLIDFFDLPMSSTSAGIPKQELFDIEGFNVLGMICFDVAFPLSFLDETKNADFIINVSNDTWFGDSYGPYQHLQIVRARALEANKWILRGTSDGISTIVDNKGTIVEIITKGIRGSLSGKVYKVDDPSYFYKIGYLIIPLLSIFVFIMVIILRFVL